MQFITGQATTKKILHALYRSIEKNIGVFYPKEALFQRERKIFFSSTETKSRAQLVLYVLIISVRLNILNNTGLIQFRHTWCVT